MSSPSEIQLAHNVGAPDFEKLVSSVIGRVDKEKLEDLRKDFHTRLSLTLTQPDNPEIVEDLWDFFYDWSFFENNLPEGIEELTQEERIVWQHAKMGNIRSVFQIQKVNAQEFKMKDLYTSESYIVVNTTQNTTAYSKGDLIEARLLSDTSESKKQRFLFIRKPSFHQAEVHSYIKAKIKQFRKLKEPETYQGWLWLLVGMFLKHRLYSHLPIDKIYNDTSRI